MAAPRRDLPKHAPITKHGFAEGFARRVDRQRTARQIQRDAEERAQAILALGRENFEAAQRAAADVFAHAQADIAKVLQEQPDYQALIRSKTYLIIRRVVDRHGIAFSALMQLQRKNAAAARARAEAVREIERALPLLSEEDIGALFGVTGRTVRKWRGQG
ncbi:hypothetical protein [Tianweitania sediminis]|uniref:Uncharacterized protein n=1 Tax=Tianweitania sediminis TaxID=1502156 RepID=A0A8J7R7L0_9HYPH|nr:hypothetical protein [Tianweitania sediminis]MBP0439602.1 hypothetical protein [Tianweitania sediminis]